MNILLVLIPVTLLIVLLAVLLFFWAVNHQQFDDMDSPGILPLLDEDPAPRNPEPEAGKAPDPDEEAKAPSPPPRTDIARRHAQKPQEPARGRCSCDSPIPPQKHRPQAGSYRCGKWPVSPCRCPQPPSPPQKP